MRQRAETRGMLLLELEPTVVFFPYKMSMAAIKAAVWYPMAINGKFHSWGNVPTRVQSAVILPDFSNVVNSVSVFVEESACMVFFSSKNLYSAFAPVILVHQLTTL